MQSFLKSRSLDRTAEGKRKEVDGGDWDRKVTMVASGKEYKVAVGVEWGNERHNGGKCVVEG